MNKLIKSVAVAVSAVVVIFLLIFIFRTKEYFINGSIEVHRIATIAIEQNKPSVCGKIIMIPNVMSDTTTGELRQQCYEETAKGLKDQTVCENIPELENRESCYLHLAWFLNDESICKFTHPTYEGMCYGAVAQQKKDEKVCESVLSESSRERCYSDLNQIIGDISICEDKIHTTEWKDHCYFSVILASSEQGDKKLTSGEKLICEKIVTPNIKDDCIRYYNDSIASQEKIKNIYSTDTTNKVPPVITVSSLNVGVGSPVGISGKGFSNQENTVSFESVPPLPYGIATFYLLPLPMPSSEETPPREVLTPFYIPEFLSQPGVSGDKQIPVTPGKYKIILSYGNVKSNVVYLNVVPKDTITKTTINNADSADFKLSSFKITFPAEGAKLVLGQKYDITWTAYEPAGGTYHLKLIDNSDFSNIKLLGDIRVLSYGDPSYRLYSNNSFSWLADGISVGNDYRLQVSDLNNNILYNSSAFSVVSSDR